MIAYTAISGIIMLTAEKLITEEYSIRKLIIRTLAVILSIVTIIYKETLQKIIDVSQSVFDIFMWTRWVDIGYLTWSIITMIYFLYFNIQTTHLKTLKI